MGDRSESVDVPRIQHPRNQGELGQGMLLHARWIRGDLRGWQIAQVSQCFAIGASSQGFVERSEARLLAHHVSRRPARQVQSKAEVCGAPMRDSDGTDDGDQPRSTEVLPFNRHRAYLTDIPYTAKPSRRASAAVFSGTGAAAAWSSSVRWPAEMTGVSNSIQVGFSPAAPRQSKVSPVRMAISQGEMARSFKRIRIGSVVRGAVFIVSMARPALQAQTLLP